MIMIRKAACAVALIAATFLWIGCGNVYRPISTPLPVTNGSPSGPETEVVLNQCPLGPIGCHEGATVYPSVLATIDVSGDTQGIWGPLQTQVGSQFGPVAGSLASTGSPMAFAFDRMSVFTANTANDSVTQLPLNPSSAGFSAPTTFSTFLLPCNSAPIGISFQYFGSTYTQDYVVNSGTGTAVCTIPPPCPVGSLGVILQGTTDQLAATTTCVGVKPVFAWIYFNQSKVYVLDYIENQVYVVNASSPYLVLRKIPVGSGPIKAAQSNNGQYVYVLNSGDGSISIIDGSVDAVVNTVSLANPGTVALPIDIAQDTNFNDTSANTQKNNVWILHADGTVSVWDGTTPGALSWITSVATITTAQAGAPTFAYPTNLGLLRDGTEAYVGVGNTDQIVGINTSLLYNGVVTPGVNAAPGGFTATTTIPVEIVVAGVNHASVTQTLTGTSGAKTVLVEATTPTVNSIAVSRQGSLTGSTGYSPDLSKVYATTTTNTIYYCYDHANVNPTDCSNADQWDIPNTSSFLVAGCTDLPGQNAMSCPNLYNGTAVVTAADGAEGVPCTDINCYVLTIAAPAENGSAEDGSCIPETSGYDAQKYCPAMAPVQVLGRN